MSQRRRAKVPRRGTDATAVDAARTPATAPPADSTAAADNAAAATAAWPRLAHRFARYAFLAHVAGQRIERKPFLAATATPLTRAAMDDVVRRAAAILEQVFGLALVPLEESRRAGDGRPVGAAAAATLAATQASVGATAPPPSMAAAASPGLLLTTAGAPRPLDHLDWTTRHARAAQPAFPDAAADPPPPPEKTRVVGAWMLVNRLPAAAPGRHLGAGAAAAPGLGDAAAPTPATAPPPRARRSHRRRGSSPADDNGDDGSEANEVDVDANDDAAHGDAANGDAADGDGPIALHRLIPPCQPERDGVLAMTLFLILEQGGVLRESALRRSLMQLGHDDATAPFALTATDGTGVPVVREAKLFRDLAAQGWLKVTAPRRDAAPPAPGWPEDGDRELRWGPKALASVSLDHMVDFALSFYPDHPSQPQVRASLVMKLAKLMHS
ncbi:hypothetical protein CXG81DRAFT_27156 [Caulochytrium protostelioides]|uniref:Uncharacterized protein n=1 Tax=Caulochytrium protostelioides TaxID=1555241 RepID=A0A4P9X4X9_9FUNG|nr:hypothetical protein CXG81DRAFT_27156 [Caulochytrium protostelioides]|eukprot:RKP00122.1 hypothetical protein CXG81DRAFT_27156 [Caulochytrium protostelioides]